MLRLLAVGYWLLAFGAVTAASAKLPPGAVLLDPDFLPDPKCVESIAVSPDGHQVAYVSHGSLWVCDVKQGPPRKLIELPNTVTDYLARPEHAEEREKYATLAANPYHYPLHSLWFEMVNVYNLAWTPSQHELTLVLARRVQQKGSVSSFRVLQVTLAGGTTQLAEFQKDLMTRAESQLRFQVTPNRKWLVVSEYGRPFIWDLTTNKPRATAFDELLVSPTSGRGLGIELDTRELVLTDESLQITKRFEVVFDQRRRSELFWSPDERFVICRMHDDQSERSTDHCSYFRFELETGERGPLLRGLDKDRFWLADSGEAYRYGVSGLQRPWIEYGNFSASLQRITQQGELGPVLRRTEISGREGSQWSAFYYPPLLANRECTLFAMALPRKNDTPPGYHYQLIERNRLATPFRPINHSDFFSPYLPIAFADGGKILIARNRTQLFSVPIDEIRQPPEANYEAE